MAKKKRRRITFMTIPFVACRLCKRLMSGIYCSSIRHTCQGCGGVSLCKNERAKERKRRGLGEFHKLKRKTR